MTATSVGIIGANSERSWAAMTHVPALKSLPGLYSLDAVATSRPESAAASKEAFGASYAFSSGFELIQSDVDLVVIAVRVPYHLELIEAAIESGKKFYCEWPLVRNSAEAAQVRRELVGKARPHAIGLQGRFNPTVLRAAELISSGRIGEVNSVQVLAARGPRVRDGKMPDFASYTVDAAAGAGALEVGGGHALDVVEQLVGPIDIVSAATATRSPNFTTTTGRAVTATAPDHVVGHFRATGGAPGTFQIFDGLVVGPHVRISVFGTDGTVTISDVRGNGGAGLQIADLQLTVSQRVGAADLTFDTPEQAQLSRAAQNVRDIYQRFASGGEVPSIDDAVRLHSLIDAIKEGASKVATEPLSL
ncbi:Gfo/Idh/MocA family oxidoreductase [Tsukamurella tyrosinosolvens]|uniref:Gfo/Idh/MocA family protein n=1 Tax=Tsukamurella tyrosinosolvens TaxID=57704 RepID=UPI0009EEB7D9|nr:Gfo/Idh/MocA family oxidoreductase [Tsukamurella tyrosinosolvens]MCA4993560.1 Gfo/Idh/MocA family oxidoreductase [Tsukamurella tyrosinosolvens]QRY83115.1 Gfo/Idh/MocA family oxidoreductase [Tsukamurella tyrosinosolvens]